eukprot:3933331-Rhodomonas_salina.1
MKNASARIGNQEAIEILNRLQTLPEYPGQSELGQVSDWQTSRDHISHGQYQPLPPLAHTHR